MFLAFFLEDLTSPFFFIPFPPLEYDLPFLSCLCSPFNFPSCHFPPSSIFLWIVSSFLHLLISYFYLLITGTFPTHKRSLPVFAPLPQTPVTHGHLMPSSAEPVGSCTTCRAHQSVQDARTDGLKKYLISAQSFPAETKSVLDS